MSLGHRRLATWYTLIAQQLEAGLRLRDALVTVSSGFPTAATQAMTAAIDRGGTVDDALRAADGWLPYTDQLTLSAAAEAGRMPQLLRNLAARHAQIGNAKVRIVLACLYPLGILHFGLLVWPVLGMIDWEKGFRWSTTTYVRDLMLTLLPLWLLIGTVLLAARRQSPWLWAVTRRLPIIGGYVRAQALGDLSFALGNFVEAGVPIGNAWAAAGLVSRSPELRQCAEAMAATVEQGAGPGTRLGAWKCMPPEVVAQYRTGEATGQLDAALLTVAAQQQERANRALTLTMMVYPALMFLVVAGGVAYAVVSIYGSYLKMVMKLAQ